MEFTWIPYYRELAQKLLAYRHDRTPLIKWIYDDKELKSGYLYDTGGKDDQFTDIDPFSIFGIFNRGISEANRLHITDLFKTFFKMDAETPKDFNAIPTLNNQKAYFFGRSDKRGANDIENLWSLFEKAIKNEDIEAAYNTVIEQFGIKINITMGLFWIQPDKYLAFDSTNQNYLKSQYNITLPKKAPKYTEYITILNDIKAKMETNEVTEKTFYELSANANNNRESKNDSQGTETNAEIVELLELLKHRQNIVLYGAPGTGKTYMVPEIAVRLCDPNFKVQSRDDLMARYKQLKQEKRIVFTTFHQSMDYEDWIEGLKPTTNNDNQVTYSVEAGIFKQMCEDARRPIVKDRQIGIADDAVVWKVSLCGAGDNPVRKECLANGHIRIGWDDYGPTISDETD